MTKQNATSGYRFDHFVLDIQNRQLRRNDVPVRLSSRYFDVLVLLVSNAGQLVEKPRIFAEVWNDIIVSDTSLTQCIKSIRKQLGDDAKNPRYLKTVPKHGYVFISEVVEIHPGILPPSLKGKQLRPYKFLDYYTENDRGLFFGRETEIEKICSRILSHRSFLLYGRSGVGKSSILRAGLIPRLQDQGHQTCIIRSFTNPLQQMSHVIRQLVKDDSVETNESDEETIRLLLHRFQSQSDKSSHLVIMLDQFEEFFLLLDENIQEAFIKELGTLMEDDSLSLQFVFVMREDMLAEISQLKPVFPEIFYHEYRLGRLAPHQAAQAIQGPAWRVGCRFEDILVKRLLMDLSEQKSVDPPHLQIVCDTLYDQRNTKGLITEVAYDQLGGSSKILADYLVRVLRRFSSADLAVVQQILVALISADERLIISREAELVSRIQMSDPGIDTLGSLLEELVEARIVRRRNQEGEGWLELAHECLVPEVSRWLTNSVYEAKQARSLLERSVENYRTYQLILDRETLDLLSPYLEELGISGQEAYLLCISLLSRDRPVPPWLVERVPDALNVILEATNNDRQEVRQRAVESSSPVRCTGLNNRLRYLALRDPALTVRRAASIELADWFGAAVETILTHPTGNESVSRLQRAVSLAFLKEQNKSVKLSRIYRIMVMIGLVLMRLQRGGIDILQQGIGGTFGGGMAGLLGGLFLGSVLAITGTGLSSGTLSSIIFLAGLGLFGGAFGGAGVSFGMVALRRITKRFNRGLGVVGGALGGAIVGGTFNLYSTDTLETLFGQYPTGLTGGIDAAIVGAGVSVGPVITHYLVKRPGQWKGILYIAFGGLGAMSASIILALLGGNMFTGNLEILRQSFVSSQIRLETIAMIFGEVEFGQTTRVALCGMEGLLFGSGVMAGIVTFMRSRERMDQVDNLDLVSPNFPKKVDEP